MPGNDTFFFRIDPETKKRLQKAARTAGVSMTTFVTEAVRKAASEAERRKPPALPKAGFRGVPSFFQASCMEAQQGGENGYRWAGHTLARHGGELLELSYSDAEEVADKLDELAEALHTEPDEANVLTWFDREFPKCMELVPSRRRGQFVQGVAEAYEEGLLPMWSKGRGRR
jgi:predicted transcriptional regulator